MSDLKTCALQYAARGWPVFPLKPGEKTPVYEWDQEQNPDNWNNSSTNPEQINEWWNENPDFNIGFEPAMANLLVLDFDPDYDEQYIEHRRETKLVSITPRGHHEFYELSDDDKRPGNTVSAVGENIDVRCHHGYVLLPPSTIAKSSGHPGGAYDWDGTGKESPAFRDDVVYARAFKNAKERTEDWDIWTIEPDQRKHIIQAIEWLNGDIKVCIAGKNGNTVAYATACMMRSFGLSREMAAQVMAEHEWNLERNKPPWEEHELLNEDGSPGPCITAYEYPTSAPGNCTTEYQRKKRDVSHLFEKVKERARKKREYGDGDDDEGTMGVTNTEGEEGVREGGTERRKYIAHTRGELATLVEPPWLIPGVLPQQGFGILYGPPGSHKSFIALAMAMSVAQGGQPSRRKGKPGADQPLWAWPVVQDGGPVLFAAGEGRFGIRKRLRAWEMVNMPGTEDVAAENDFVLCNMLDLGANSFDDWDDLAAFCEMALEKHERYALAVIDTVARSMAGLNENSTQDATRFTKAMALLQDALGCAVLALHHTGHDATATHGRGSSGFGGDADIVMRMTKHETPKALTMEVQTAKPPRDGPDWDAPKWFQLVPVKFDPDGDEGEANTSLAAITPEPAIIKDAKRLPTAANKMTFDLNGFADDVLGFLQTKPRAYSVGKRALALDLMAEDDIETGGKRDKTITHLENILTIKGHAVKQCWKHPPNDGNGHWEGCYNGSK